MAVWKSGNWSFAEPPFADGDTVKGGNCSQLLPNTEICKTVKNLTITGGNFCNCKPQPTWTITGGNWCQKSFCSHEHPEWVARGLPVCAEDCLHRDGAVKQWVDIPEDEYRREKNSVAADKPAAQVLKAVDADGVTVQRFQKSVFVYRDGNLGSNKPKAAKAVEK